MSSGRGTREPSDGYRMAEGCIVLVELGQYNVYSVYTLTSCTPMTPSIALEGT